MQKIARGNQAQRPFMGTLSLWIAAVLCVSAGMYAGHALAPRKNLAAKPGLPLLLGGMPQPLGLPPAPRPKPFEFPAGGRQLASKYRLVALYGSPGEPALGALGEQPLSAAVDRAKSVAAAYAPLSPQPMLPTFEIIATIASASPTENGDYSREVDPAALAPWVGAAKAA